MTIDLTNYLVFLLVLIRMTGMLITNPIFGRRNVPAMMNAGFALLLSILVVNTVPLTPLPDPNFLTFALMALKEFAVGFLAGQMMLMFLSILVVGGEIIDMQLAIGMAKIFDPGTNASISLTSTLFNSMYIMVFFATNNHLTLISLTAQTFRIIPLGIYTLNWNLLYYLPEFLSTIFIFAIKLCMPIMVIEIIVTMAVGIIMRVIPQINVFVVNIQFKLLIGFFALIILVIPFTAFFENMIVICTEQIQYVWQNFVA